MEKDNCPIHSAWMKPHSFIKTGKLVSLPTHSLSLWESAPREAEIGMS